MAIEKYRRAGKLARDALNYGLEVLEVGCSYFELAEAIEGFIRKAGGAPAFPVNIGVNDVAAHYTPAAQDKKIFKKGDLVSIDVGVHIDGYIGDTAATVELGTHKWQRLIEATRLALENALATLRPGLSLSDVGAVIEDTIRSYGYLPISNLTGHSLSRYKLHAGKSVPNVRAKAALVQEGDVLAIEPFATPGAGRVANKGHGNIYRFVRFRALPTPEEEELLEHIYEKYRTLPFAARWLDSAHEKALRKLARAFAITNYPLLVEKNNAVVAQAEHTVLIRKDGAEVFA